MSQKRRLAMKQHFGEGKQRSCYKIKWITNLKK